MTAAHELSDKASSFVILVTQNESAFLNYAIPENKAHG